MMLEDFQLIQAELKQIISSSKFESIENLYRYSYFAIHEYIIHGNNWVFGLVNYVQLK